MESKKKSLSVFDFHDYREYLRQSLPTTGAERGIRSRLAQALQCQTAFVSRVLAGDVDFTFEHCPKISRFLKHTELEADFFLLLVQHGRAGTHELKQYFENKIQKILEKRQIIAERIPEKKHLTLENQVIFYSAWYYSAIHLLIGNPQLRTAPRIAEELDLPLEMVSRILEFLVSTGLIRQEGSGYTPGVTRLHLGKDSPMISKHHVNWRLQAMQAIEKAQPTGDDLFYSAPMLISRPAAKKIRELILGLIESAEPIIRDAKDEELFCFNCDFFKMGDSE